MNEYVSLHGHSLHVMIGYVVLQNVPSLSIDDFVGLQIRQLSVMDGDVMTQICRLIIICIHDILGLYVNMVRWRNTYVVLQVN